MADWVLAGGHIRAGQWEGVLTGSGPAPQIAVTHLEAALPGVSVTAIAGKSDSHAVRVPIPAHLLSDGVQTFLVREAGAEATLAHFTIVTGVPLEDDIRAELDLLRAELDMLKRAFRRHCLETAG